MPDSVLIPSQGALADYSDRVLDTPDEMLDEAICLVNRIYADSELMAPIEAYVREEAIVGEYVSETHMGAIAKADLWLRNYFLAKGMAAPGFTVDIISLLTWHLRQKLGTLKPEHIQGPSEFDAQTNSDQLYESFEDYLRASVKYNPWEPRRLSDER